MKRIFLMAVVAIISTTALAQNIAVVNSSNSTTIYQTLDDAINKATDGSVIYLPGGGFQISGETKINHRVTIMGVSHRGDTDNVDGATIIAGNLNFVESSSGSAVIGVYVTGDINVGTKTDSVLNLTVRYCNVNSIQVKHSQSSGMVVNQCYLRKGCGFGNCNVRLENNIFVSVSDIDGGIINHNIITNVEPSVVRRYTLDNVSNSSITNNFFLRWASGHKGNNCHCSNNCIGTGSWGDDPIIIEEGTNLWDDVFFAHKGVSIYSDYRLKGKWGKKAATDGTDIGIYGNIAEKKDYAPIPRIVSKKVDEQTDGSGKLKIEVKVKAF